MTHKQDCGSPDRIDGFDLARFCLNFGKSGISLAKGMRRSTGGLGITISVPQEALEPNTEYELPIELYSGAEAHSAAFDAVLPEGGEVLGFVRGEMLHSGALAITSKREGRLVIGITRMDGSAFTGDGVFGAVRIRTVFPGNHGERHPCRYQSAVDEVSTRLL